MKTASIDITPLQTDGIMILRDVLPREELDAFKDDYLSKIDDSQYLKESNPRWNMIENPIRTCRTGVALALNDTVVDIATQFFNKPCGLGTLNLRRSYPIDKADKTQLFHCDPNVPDGEFIKFFIYLNDVDMDNGPFTYVKSSHVRFPVNKRNPYRWRDEDIEQLYGKDSIVYATANYGDLVVCCTWGFHKGLKPNTHHRDLFTVNWVTQPESGTEFINQEDYDKLGKKQEYCQFLKRV